VLENILKNSTDAGLAVADKGSKRIARPAGTQWIFRYGMVLAFVALTIVTAILDPSFLQVNNLLNLLRQWAPPGLMAVGMTFVIISGGFDLSVGGTYAAAATLSAWLALRTGSEPLRRHAGNGIYRYRLDRGSLQRDAADC
jgi:ribose/xylose/arabinose/galactoside ABC-type transport system permease subunit